MDGGRIKVSGRISGCKRKIWALKEKRQIKKVPGAEGTQRLAEGWGLKKVTWDAEEPMHKIIPRGKGGGDPGPKKEAPEGTNRDLRNFLTAEMIE